MRRQIKLETGTHDGSADRLMATAVAKRGNRAFLIAAGKTPRIGGKSRVMQFRFRQKCHIFLPPTLHGRRSHRYASSDGFRNYPCGGRRTVIMPPPLQFFRL